MSPNREVACRQANTFLEGEWGLASGLAGPEGLAVLAGGDLSVVEAGAGRVSRIDTLSGAVTTGAEELGRGAPPPLVPPSWLFKGIAVGVRGDA